MVSFIISTCIRNDIHLNQLIRCIKSIKMFHIDSNIYLINDSDENYNSRINNLINNTDNTHNIGNIYVINSIKKGSADQQVFKLILDINDKSSHYVIIQDSMFLNTMLDDVDKIETVKFLWYFTNHINDWDKIIEPAIEFNITNNIKTHTDLIKYHLIKNYKDDELFLNYALNCLKNKHTWVGCFGNCCIVTKKSVEYLNNVSGFSGKFINNNTNRERRMNESIFALLCHYYLPQDYKLAYDGLYYDGINVNIYSNKPTGFDNLKYCCKKKYISKISFDR